MPKGDFCIKFAEAAKKIAPDMNRALAKQPGKIVKYSGRVIAQKLGGEFSEKKAVDLYLGLKYGLYRHGIYVERLEDDRLTVRKRMSGDRLPRSVQMACPA